MTQSPDSGCEQLQAMAADRRRFVGSDDRNVLGGGVKNLFRAIDVGYGGPTARWLSASPGSVEMSSGKQMSPIIVTAPIVQFAIAQGEIPKPIENLAFRFLMGYSQASTGNFGLIWRGRAQRRASPSRTRGVPGNEKRLALHWTKNEV